jgi:flagellar motor protein MotB
VAPNTTPRNLSLNRRTEIIVLPSLDTLTTAALFDPPEIEFRLRLVYEGDFPAAEGTLRQAAIFDALPHGLEYRLGSTRLDGQPQVDPEQVLGRGPDGQSERWLRWDLGSLAPGKVLELAYRVEITDLPESPAASAAAAAPDARVRQVAQVDSLLRDAQYRNRQHLWENRAWFGALHREATVTSDAVGADLRLAFERTQKPIRITLDDVLFDTGKANLRPEAYGVLGPAADAIRSRVGWKVRIEGHCDIRPIHTAEFPSNQELSDGRSRAVRDYLVNVEKLDPALFKVRGFGERRPIADNDTEAGRQKNRRVEIIIYADEVTDRSFEPAPPGIYPETVRLDLR